MPTQRSFSWFCLQLCAGVVVLLFTPLATAAWLQAGDAWQPDDGAELRLHADSAPAELQQDQQGYLLRGAGLLAIEHMDLPGSVRIEATLLRLRDQPGQALRFRAHGHLLIEAEQIEIHALAHADSWLESGGDLRLVSPAPIQGDAHFRAGGSLRFVDREGRPQALQSPEDPILLALGDVSMFNYVGASLHILAGGSIEISDQVRITAVETDPLHAIHRHNDALFNASEEIRTLSLVSLSDGTEIEVDGFQRPTIDLRAGVDWRNFDGGEPVPGWIGAGPPVSFNPDPPENAHISVGSLRIDPDIPAQGMVLLTNRYRTRPGLDGNITVGDISGLAVGEEAHGTEVFIDASGVVQTGVVDTRAVADQLAIGGGEVLMIAEGQVITQGISTAGSVLHGGHHAGGGNLRLLSRQASIFVPALATGFEFDDRAVWTGPAGHIELSAPDGNISIPALRLFSGNVNTFNDPTVIVGRGGDIRIQAGRRLIASELALLAQAEAPHGAATGAGGRIEVSVGEDDLLLTQALGHGHAGLGNLPGSGGMRLEALQGSVLVSQMLRSDTTAADGRVTVDTGDIELHAAGNVRVGGELRSEVLARQSTRNAGAIRVFSENGDIELGELSAWTAAQDEAGDGGAVELTALVGRVEIGDVDARASRGPVASEGGRGGDIVLRADAGIKTGALRAHHSLSSAGEYRLGDSGSIDLETRFGDIEFAEANTYIFAILDDDSVIGNAGSVRMRSQHGWIRTDADSIGTYIQQGASIDYATQVSLAGAGAILLEAGGGVQWPQDFMLRSAARGHMLSRGGGQVRVVVGHGDLHMGVIDASTALLSGPAVDGSGGVEVRVEQGQAVLNSVFGGNNARESSDPPRPVDIHARDGLQLGRVSADEFASSGDGSLAGGGAISLHSSLGNIELFDAMSSSIHKGGLFSTGSSGPGGAITVHAPQGSVAVRGMASLSQSTSAPTPDRGGAISVIAGGDIDIGDWGLNSSSLSGQLAVPALAAGAIELRSTGGAVTVLGPIRANAQSDGTATGSAGSIELEAGTVTTQDIFALGQAGTGSITIRHAGNGLVPFSVANPVPLNGSTGLYTSEASITPSASFLLSHHQPPNIWIVTEDAPLYSVGGTVSGLLGSGLVLRNNGGDDLAISGNGSFSFYTQLMDGSPYAVSVHQQPNSPAQTCSVSQGSGSINGADVSNVQVSCVLPTVTVTAVAETGGQIDPAGPQQVALGQSVSFQLIPDGGHGIAEVQGCGGSLAGATYTTAPVQADCTVIASFAEQVTGTLAVTGTTPPRVGQGRFVQLTLSALTAPSQGSVMISAGTGESCTTSSPFSSTGSQTIWRCELSLASVGPRSLSASYSGSSTHLPASAASHTIAMRHADIRVSVDDAVPAVQPGSAAAYLIRIENLGPDSAPHSEVFAQAFPPLLSPQWTCFAFGATCPAASAPGLPDLRVDLPVGTALEFLVEGQYDNPLPLLVDLAALGSPDPNQPHYVFDPNPANNEAIDRNHTDLIFRNGFQGQ